MTHPKHTTPRVCQHCGAEFVPHAGAPGKYCSLPCRDQANIKRETRICPVCSKAFVCRPSYRARHCSLACSHVTTAAQQRQSAEQRKVARHCPTCENTFRVKPQSRQVYCSRACIDTAHKAAAKKPIPKTCAYCAKPFACNPWTPDVEFCSQRCHLRHNAQTVRGENHPLYKPKVPMTCEICGAVVMVKPSLVSRFRSCSRRCNALLAQQSMPRISSIEYRLHEAMLTNGLEPVSQYILGYYSLDFAFPKYRIAIECDGSYWHSRPKQRRLDHSKDGYCQSHGWLLLRFTEEEIRTQLADCVTQIKVVLHQATHHL